MTKRQGHRRKPGAPRRYVLPDPSPAHQPGPPGIPDILPGERFDRTPRMFEYREMLQDFDARLPGFEHEIHGVETGQKRYVLDRLE